MEPNIDIPETRQMPPKQAQYLYEAVSVSVIERQIPNTAQNDASYLGLAQVGLRRLLHRSALYSYLIGRSPRGPYRLSEVPAAFTLYKFRAAWTGGLAAGQRPGCRGVHADQGVRQF